MTFRELRMISAGIRIPVPLATFGIPPVFAWLTFSRGRTFSPGFRIVTRRHRLASATLSGHFVPDTSDCFAYPFGAAFKFVPVFFGDFFDDFHSVASAAISSGNRYAADRKDAVPGFFFETRSILLIHGVIPGVAVGCEHTRDERVDGEELSRARVVDAVPEVDEPGVRGRVLGVPPERRRSATFAGGCAVGAVAALAFDFPGGPR
jgi:hypothetical protein